MIIKLKQRKKILFSINAMINLKKLLAALQNKWYCKLFYQILQHRLINYLISRQKQIITKQAHLSSNKKSQVCYHWIYQTNQIKLKENLHKNLLIQNHVALSMILKIKILEIAKGIYKINTTQKINLIHKYYREFLSLSKILIYLYFYSLLLLARVLEILTYQTLIYLWTSLTKCKFSRNFLPTITLIK
ncbi:transmembrane protein, putative (macronuclear) [Tetrahymena thermophila SB210]|uniref:Transmembrane protein, putative n=1 Tax=Tetrahymena thermophila (strain SB210) TaxID=312017 RepID=W7XJZ0_TETTS|nr:transmembrane protein, putative [Tetrahymena thermophila SB210]EWS76071.1 transmembrane protein, putative [Tetrahymena thermophila SB210]|eukprot:XP_012651378.1 transmembrane protein, putative [Tetrahymena thermophila SB210]